MLVRSSEPAGRYYLYYVLDKVSVISVAAAAQDTSRHGAMAMTLEADMLTVTEEPVHVIFLRTGKRFM